MNNKNRELQSVLEYCGLTLLPKAWNGETSKKIWVDAIIEIRKIDGSESYAYAHNQYACDPIYKKVFGRSATIREILAIYPIHYLDKEFIEHFDNIEYLRRRMGEVYGLTETRIAEISDENIINMAYNNAIQSQIVFIKQDGKEKYKQDLKQKNEQLFKEITEGAGKRNEKKD